ncbi:ankyrin [Achaetomium macrosporum]|uniref:Ankyrin n=1 Tax=Achaetomium macrosporum TaxID=79813 RepID=A0AAN7H9S0_9PEZI|nr:ankyrin [Achaetomium macrosporum]
MEPNFNSLVHTYLKHGNREHLAGLLPLWSPAIDEDHVSIGLALHHAICIGDETAVRMMLDAGVRPTVVDGHEPNYTPILTASQYGRREMARLFWRLVGPDGRFYPSLRRRSELTCLVVAAQYGQADLVADFLDMWDGWSVDEKRRALLDAAAEWNDNVVTVLLAKVGYEVDDIQEALGQCVDSGPGSTHYIGADDGDTPEYNARAHRLVCRLVDAGGNADATYLERPLLCIAAPLADRIGALKALLEKGANPNIQNVEGRTPLHATFRFSSSSIEALRLLLDHGASPEIPDQDGATPLHAAAYGSSLDKLQLCLARCADADAALRLQTRHRESLLHYAAAGGKQDIAEFLLDRGVPVDAANTNGWTPLLCALMPTPPKALAKACSLASLLLQRGARADVVTDEGWTALHALASHRPRLYWEPAADAQDDRSKWAPAVPLVRELVARGAPLYTPSSVIRSPAVTAETVSGAWGVRMQRLLANEATTTASANTETTRPGTVQPGAEAEEEEEGTTPLVWACRTGAMVAFDAVIAEDGEPNNCPQSDQF